MSRERRSSTRSPPFGTVPFGTVPFRAVPFRAVPFRAAPLSTVPFGTAGPGAACPGRRGTTIPGRRRAGVRLDRKDRALAGARPEDNGARRSALLDDHVLVDAHMHVGQLSN